MNYTEYIGKKFKITRAALHYSLSLCFRNKKYFSDSSKSQGPPDRSLIAMGMSINPITNTNENGIIQRFRVSYHFIILLHFHLLLLPPTKIKYRICSTTKTKMGILISLSILMFSGIFILIPRLIKKIH